MTLHELERKLVELDELRTELKSTIDEVKSGVGEKPKPPHPRWKPDEDGDYYILMGSGTPSQWIWHADNDDGACIKRYSIGNVFKTREEAEFAAERLKVLTEMREWSGNTHFGAHIYYHRPSDQIMIDWDGNSSYFYGDIRFKSVDDALNCIQAVGKNRMKKYYFMVPEDEYDSD